MKQTTKVVETEHQIRVRELIIKGLTNQEIADELGITLSGAKYHVANILKAWNVTSRAKLVAKVRGLK